MTISLVQQPDTSYTTSGTAKSNTFAVAPTSGNLIVFNVVAANNVTITADDGTLTEIGTGYETFRRISTFAKIAGGSEPTTYGFTFSGSATGFVFATEYSTTDSWDSLANTQHSIVFDTSGTSFDVTANLTATAGSNLVACGYSSNSTTNNQQITAGYGNFEQVDATGNSRWAAQADKTTAGGSDSATFGLIDETTNNRLAVALAEFPVVSGLTLDSTPTDVNSQTQESSVVSNPATAPTTGNTQVKFDDDLGPAATMNSVTGSDPYTLNYTFPRTTTKLFSATGYPLYHEVDAGYAEFPYDSTRTVIAGAYHVDPVNGSDTNNGILVADGGTGPWQTINTNLATLVAGDTMYLREGTHTVTSINMKFGHNDGTAGNLIEVTSYPGEEPLIDCSGDTTWLRFQNLDYWKFSHLKLTNYISAWEVGEDVTVNNCEWYSIQGDTALGGDNVGLIKMREASNFSVDRVKVTLTVDQATVHQNTGGLYHIDNNDSMSGTYNRVEAYGFPSGIYFKHGFGTIASHTGNITVSNSFFYNCNRNAIGYNPAGVKFENCIFHTDVNLSEADGGEAGDWNWFDHCTFYANANLRDQLTGATNNKFTNNIITTLDIKGSSSVTSDSDYNLFVNNIEDGATSRTLASWQTANSSDANSLQGTPTYAGSDFSLIASYALAGGSAGEDAASDSSDIGVDVASVGIAPPKESVTSGNVPYLPVSGQTYIDLVTPVNTAGTLGETYAGSPAATGDQWVYDTNLTGDASITLTQDAQGHWILSGTPSANSAASFYRIDSTGTVDIEDTISFVVDSLPAAAKANRNAIIKEPIEIIIKLIIE